MSFIVKCHIKILVSLVSKILLNYRFTNLWAVFKKYIKFDKDFHYLLKLPANLLNGKLFYEGENQNRFPQNIVTAVR